MRLRDSLLAMGFVCFVAGQAVAGPMVFQAHDPVSHSFFDVFADLADAQTKGPPPVRDLSNPMHLLLTQDVKYYAVFSFGMLGPNGETFSFGNLHVITHEAGHSLPLSIEATGNQGSFFDVFFNASYLTDTGSHSPFDAVMQKGPPPVFPQGSFSIDYTLHADPPFTVDISLVNPAGGNQDPVTFNAVPEPGSVALVLSGALALGACGWIRRRARGIAP